MSDDITFGQKNAAIHAYKQKLVKYGFLSMDEMNAAPDYYGLSTKNATAKLQHFLIEQKLLTAADVAGSDGFYNPATERAFARHMALHPSEAAMAAAPPVSKEIRPTSAPTPEPVVEAPKPLASKPRPLPEVAVALNYEPLRIAATTTAPRSAQAIATSPASPAKDEGLLAAIESRLAPLKERLTSLFDDAPGAPETAHSRGERNLSPFLTAWRMPLPGMFPPKPYEAPPRPAFIEPDILTNGRPATEAEINAAKNTASLSREDLRELQANLFFLNHFGKRRTLELKSTEHVTYHAHPKLKEAVASFIAHHGREYGLTSTALTQGLLAATRAENTMPVLKNDDDLTPMQRAQLSICQALDDAFQQSAPAKLRHELATLNPIARPALLAALDELKGVGIHCSVRDVYRDDANQRQALRHGFSWVPPGWSHHQWGLAYDIYPLDAKGHAMMQHLDKKGHLKPIWQTMQVTLERHGFLSLYQYTQRETDKPKDPPHHQIPYADIADIRQWPRTERGWVIVPPDHIPAQWREANLIYLDKHMPKTTEIASNELPTAPQTGQPNMRKGQAPRGP